MEVVFALITAFAFGFDYYFIRKGLITDPYPLLAAYITLTVNFSFFIVLFLSYFFLRSVEVITSKTVLATLMVVCGMAVLIAGK